MPSDEELVSEINSEFCPQRILLTNIQHLKLHQDLINSLMVSIKPSIIEYYYSPYTKESIKSFVCAIRQELENENKIE